MRTTPFGVEFGPVEELDGFLTIFHNLERKAPDDRIRRPTWTAATTVGRGSTAAAEPPHSRDSDQATGVRTGSVRGGAHASCLVRRSPLANPNLYLYSTVAR